MNNVATLLDRGGGMTFESENLVPSSIYIFLTWFLNVNGYLQKK